MDTKKLTKIDVIRRRQGVVDHGLKGLQIPVPLTLELCSGQAMPKHDKTMAQNGRVGGQKNSLHKVRPIFNPDHHSDQLVMHKLWSQSPV